MPEWEHIPCGGVFSNPRVPPDECPGCFGEPRWRYLGSSPNRQAPRVRRMRPQQRTARYRLLAARDGEFCQICGSTTFLTIDHIQPSSKGGTNHPSNTQLLCEPCNRRKADIWPWSLEEARAQLSDEHRLRLKERIQSLAPVLPTDA